MNILFVGDVVGKLGRKTLERNLSNIINKYDIVFSIVNAENITNGRGINLNHYNFLNKLDFVDAITLGNHYLDKKEELSLFIDNDNVVPPLNSLDDLLKSSKDNIETRSKLFLVEYMSKVVKIRVTSVLGSTFMKEEVISPIKAISYLLDKIARKEEETKERDNDIHIIDFHAETNGEKYSIAYYFIGEISALIGTHTHVQTKDNKLLVSKDNPSLKTLYISDVGMCGDNLGILGFEYKSVIERQLLGYKKVSMKLMDDSSTIFSAVILKFDDLSFEPISITPIYLEESKKK